MGKGRQVVGCCHAHKLETAKIREYHSIYPSCKPKKQIVLWNILI